MSSEGQAPGEPLTSQEGGGECAAGCFLFFVFFAISELCACPTSENCSVEETDVI